MLFRRAVFGHAAVLAVISLQTANAQGVGYIDPYISLQPTSWVQCGRQNLPSFSALEEAKEEKKKCLRQPSENTRWVMYSECRFPGPSQCESAENRQCELHSKIEREGRLCSERVREYESRKAERDRLEKERLSTEDAAARDAMRQQSIAREMVENALSNGDLGQAGMILDRYVDPTNPTSAPSQLARDGRMLSTMLGVSRSPAMQLQKHLQSLSMNAYRDLTGNAMSQLDAATGSGAFSLDATDASSGNTAISQATPLTPGGFTADEISTLTSAWQDGGGFDRMAVATAIISQIVDIFESTPSQGAGVRARPSLVDGVFARNLVRFSAATARGEVSMHDNFVTAMELSIPIFEHKSTTESPKQEIITSPDFIVDEVNNLSSRNSSIGLKCNGVDRDFADEHLWTLVEESEINSCFRDSNYFSMPSREYICEDYSMHCCLERDVNFINAMQLHDHLINETVLYCKKRM